MVKLNRKDSERLINKIFTDLNKPAYMIPTPKLDKVKILILEDLKDETINILGNN